MVIGAGATTGRSIPHTQLPSLRLVRMAKYTTDDEKMHTKRRRRSLVQYMFLGAYIRILL